MMILLYVFSLANTSDKVDEMSGFVTATKDTILHSAQLDTGTKKHPKFH